MTVRFLVVNHIIGLNECKILVVGVGVGGGEGMLDPSTRLFLPLHNAHPGGDLGAGSKVQ